MDSLNSIHRIAPDAALSLAKGSSGITSKEETAPGDSFARSPETGDLSGRMPVSKTDLPDPLLGALDIREKLETLKGVEKEAYIREFREKNAGKLFVSIDMHNHQPIYRPGTHPADTPEIQRYVLGTGDADNRREVYRDADAYAIEAMKDKPQFPHFGFQVSYSGSLMENLEKTKEKGLWPGEGWSTHYKNVRRDTHTSLGGPRLDLVNIGYHHPLMGLIASGNPQEGQEDPDKDIQLQLKMHQYAVEKLFGAPVSKGFFPPEMAFSERMIPAIKKVGIEWTMVDNLHFDRANEDYENSADGLKPPNRADSRNPGPHTYETLPNDLAKVHKVSPEALRPHYVKHINPVNGNEELMIVVPEERSLSSYIQKDRDASKLQDVINKFGKYDTDPAHPLFVLYATDGDNNGSNSGEFHRNVPIDLATRYPDQVVFTTIQDYLELFPPEKPQLVSDQKGVKHYRGGDVIHVEDGAWWGANLGDPQFSKWIDDPAYTGYSPKNNSWAVLTAAKNEVLTADQMEPAGAAKESVGNIIDNKGSDTEQAWHGLLVGQTSCYEYWNPDNVLSYSSVRGANMAVDAARKVLSRHPKEEDHVGPSVFLPMHYPYNPKGYPSSFNVVTYAYDINDVKSVKVKFRTDEDGILNRPEDFMYDGKDVKPWDHETYLNKMPFPDLPSHPDVWVDPRARADVYRGKIDIEIPEGKPGEMIQYFVEAVDGLGNLTRSPIQNVYVTNSGGSNPGDITNEEIHKQLSSGNPQVMAQTIGLVFTIGRNDRDVFNHVFYRLDKADEALMQNLEVLASKGQIKLSGDPKFRDEYINRLDGHLLKEENVAKLKSKRTLADSMSKPLADMASDPRVKRILEKLS